MINEIDVDRRHVFVEAKADNQPVFQEVSSNNNDLQNARKSMNAEIFPYTSGRKDQQSGGKTQYLNEDLALGNSAMLDVASNRFQCRCELRVRLHLRH